MVAKIQPIIDAERGSLLDGLANEELQHCIDVLQQLLERSSGD